MVVIFLGIQESSMDTADTEGFKKNPKGGCEENCELHQQMHHHYFISSSTQIFLCSKHCFELLVSTILAICHCCIHSFVKSSEGARRWRERYRQTNYPFISCKGRKKIGHLVCWDHAAALGVVSIYIIACNKCDNICVLDIKSEKNIIYLKFIQVYILICQPYGGKLATSVAQIRSALINIKQWISLDLVVCFNVDYL